MDIEERCLERYKDAVMDRDRTAYVLQEAVAETELSAYILKNASDKYAEYTEHGDKAPKNISRSMKEAYTRNNNAIDRENYLHKRLARKEKALINLRRIHETAVKNTSKAMEKQVACCTKRKSSGLAA